MRKIIPMVLLLGALFWGCGAPRSSADESTYLRAILPDSLMQYAHLEAASEKSVTLEGSGGSQYLGLRVFPGQRKVHGGARAEVSVDFPFQQGETVSYAWRFMLPDDFVSDAPRNRWWIIGQWHDQPNPKLGETWETFHSVSPPVLLGLGELEGKPALTLTYGPTNEKRKQHVAGPIFLKRGAWHQITAVIHWSRGPEGKASIFLDDPAKPALTAEGPNMNNGYTHYLKVGMYRHPDIETDNRIYVDDIEISKGETVVSGGT